MAQQQAFQSHQNKALSNNAEATLRQREAADPLVSAWVNASAGTGKTRVLTDRVLRLLLPCYVPETKKWIKGARPESILCLTFTKAAAGEMIARVLGRVEHWRMMDTESCRGELADLMGLAPDDIIDNVVDDAQRLFAQLIDLPEGVQIKTIHSFAQSLLGRFPIEAGVSPQLVLLEEDRFAQIRSQAIDHVISQWIGDTERQAWLREMIGLSGVEGLRNSLDKMVQKLLTMPQDDTRKELLIADFMIESDLPRIYHDAVRMGDKKALASVAKECVVSLLRSPMMARFFAAQEEAKNNGFHANRGDIKTALDITYRAMQMDELGSGHVMTLARMMRKGDGGFYVPKSIIIGELKKQAPDSAAWFIETLAPALQNIVQAETLLTLSTESKLFTQLAEDVVARIHVLKTLCNGLTYDDIIAKAAQLLSRPTDETESLSPLSWIHYKLDARIDHVLVDEAQDTSANQWQVINALVAEFYTQQPVHDIRDAADRPRTLFVVGDEKQSIYGFHGAEPRLFATQRRFHRARAHAVGAQWRDVSMAVNFRSHAGVLGFVDLIFNRPEHYSRVTQPRQEHHDIQHKASDQNVTKRTEISLWPLFKETLNDKGKPEKVTRDEMYDWVAQHLRDVFDAKTWCQTTQAPLRPKDVLILLRQRNPMMPKLMHALHKQGIPVAGPDRLVLATDPVVMDVIALCRFMTAPSDNLTLATVLKSPFCGASDEDLLRITPAKTTLWQALLSFAQNNPEHHLSNCAEYLRDWLAHAAKLTPFALVEAILSSPCVIDERSARRALTRVFGASAHDPLRQLLSILLDLRGDKGLSLVDVVNHFSPIQTEIKRSTGGNETVLDEVRIMTVHNAKGLEAPMVILPDTTFNPAKVKAGNGMVWMSNQDRDDPNAKAGLLFRRAPKSAQAISAALQDQIAFDENQEHAECDRLLYVALTRAKERIVVMGAMKGGAAQKIPKQSWYDIVQRSMQELSETNPDQVDILNQPVKGIYRWHHGTLNQTAQTSQQNQKGQTSDIVRPEWIDLMAQAEAQDQRPLRPSQVVDDAKDDTPAAHTPRHALEVQETDAPAAGQSDNMVTWLSPQQRGTLIHDMIRLALSLSEEDREPTLCRYVAHPKHGLAPRTQAWLCQEVGRVLSHPLLQSMSAQKIYTELPVSGSVTLSAVERRELGEAEASDPKTVHLSAQLDIVARDPVQKTITLVDFKTTRTPPKESTSLPYAYRVQMYLYKKLFTHLYPDDHITTVLLWTADGSVTPV